MVNLSKISAFFEKDLLFKIVFLPKTKIYKSQARLYV